MSSYLAWLRHVAWRSDRLCVWTWRRMLEKTRLEWPAHKKAPRQ